MPDGSVIRPNMLAVERCIPDHLHQLLHGAPASVLAGLGQTFEAKCADIAWTGFHDGRPVFAAGIIVHWEGTGRDGHPSGLGEAWAASGSAPVPRRFWPEITSRARTQIDMALAVRLRLIECTVLARFDAGHRWARHLGFVRAAARPGWSPEGDDAVLYHRHRGMI